MPDEKAEFTRYSAYFSRSAPSIRRQVVALIAIGIATGVLSIGMIHGIAEPITFIYGIVPGVLVVSVPAMLTISLLKASHRKMQLKHISFATLIAASSYSLFILLGSTLFSITKSSALAYVVLLLGNAVVYGYWIFVGKFFIGRGRTAPFTAAVQPLLNILLYVPMGGYILSINIPLRMLLEKLFAGMLVFLAVVYFFMYLVDKPMKRALNISSVRMFALMANQWLSSFGADDYFSRSAFGTKKDMLVDVLILRKDHGPYKAIFVKPDIHFGPFSGVGGSIATEVMGRNLLRNFNASPVVLHGAVNIADNPVSSTQVYSISGTMCQHIRGIGAESFSKAYGNISIGQDAPCTAITVSINQSRMVFLTKAPLVVEDIDSEVGAKLARVASHGNAHAIIIDTHNSRQESASSEELRGVHTESIYAVKYENAIKAAIQKKSQKELMFGISHERLAEKLGYPKDMGRAFATVSVFDFAGDRLCLVYLDANNMLPRFRQEIISHIEEKYRMRAEVCTTDTHEINSLALPASNALGRFTRIKKLLPLLDSMVAKALEDVEPVYAHSSQFTMHNFRIWGKHADAALTKASTDILKVTKDVMPFVLTAGFIIAAWIIYIA